MALPGWRNNTFTGLERIYVTFDGAIKALYEDNALLLLSGDGSSFTQVTADGLKTVQLSECCLSRWKPLLAELLEFRNQHFDLPCVPACLKQQLQQQGLLFTTGYPITDVTWPSTPQDAFEQGLVELANAGATVVHSQCGSTYITLEQSGLRFAVCYPLLVEHDPASGTYTYTQHTQVLSRNQYPERWQPVLEVVAAVAQTAAEGAIPAARPRCWPGQQHDEQQQWHHKGQQHLLQQLEQPQQLLRDVTNQLASAFHHHGNGSSCHTSQGPAALHAATNTAKLLGSPLQKQQTCCHAGSHQVQQQPQWGLKSCSGAGQRPAGSPASPAAHQGRWTPFSSSGSPPRALLAVAEQQQQQQQLAEEDGMLAPWTSSPTQTLPAAAAAAVCGHYSTQCVTRLPLMASVLQSLPAWCQQQQQQQSRSVLAASSSSHSCWNSRIAAALAQTLGQQQQGRGGGGSSSSGGSWWLEPSLLLPHDELLQMVWSRDATFIFIQGTGEVEVWLHADDSCMYSFQGGTFITHIWPHAAAAASWDDGNDTAATSPDSAAVLAPVATGIRALTATSPAGAAGAAAQTAGQSRGTLLRGNTQLPDSLAVSGFGCSQVDTQDMSRVYAANALPAELTLPVQCGRAALPLGRIAAEALRFRSTMLRVQQTLAEAAETGAPTASHIFGEPAAGAYHAALVPSYTASHHRNQHCQQQQQLSLQVVEEQDVPGMGRFIAYADGRVRVLFEDRTILSMDAGRAQATVLLPDGTKHEVTASNPVGLEQYVQPALEFAAWSSCTPVQRAAALRMEALVAAELRSSARMAAICEWGSNPRRPPEAACLVGNLAAHVGALQLAEDCGHESRAPASGRGWQLGLQQQELCSNSVATSGRIFPGHDWDSNGRKRMVEGLLQANSLLLQRL